MSEIKVGQRWNGKHRFHNGEYLYITAVLLEVGRVKYIHYRSDGSIILANGEVPIESVLDWGEHYPE